LVAGGLDPTLVVGGRLKATQSGARLGQGEYFVAEADESDGSFLKLSPTIAIVTNIDNDHLDYYQSIERLEDAFVEFANHVPFYGLSILCFDDFRCRRLAARLKRRYVSYGLDGDVDFKAVNIQFLTDRSAFNVHQGGQVLGRIELQVPGHHNVLNALAAVVVAVELGINFKDVAQALSEFQGVGRRLEVRGQEAGVTVIDDYGHHPTEIRCTLAAIRQRWPEKRLLVIFQPHRYSRTQLLAEEFGGCFNDADAVYVLPIYSAGEKPISGVSSLLITEKLGSKSPLAHPFQIDKDFPRFLSQLKSGDVVLTLGAGDVWKLGPKILSKLVEVRS